MPYATEAQMVARFTEREVIALTDRVNAGQVDAEVLADALVSASTEVDAYIGRRYALPLAIGGVAIANTPGLLVGLCCDIARYRLTGTEVQETEAIRSRYRDALQVLKLLASGEVVLAEAPDLLPATSTNSRGASAVVNEREREFGADTLGGY